MNILTFDTVLNKTFISIFFEGKKIFETILSDEKNYHSVYLVKKIKEILEKNSISLSAFDFLGVNVGTGSFTGIRVGLAIAKVISGQLGLKVVAFNSFEALSLAYKTKNIMTNAGRGQVFYCKDGKNAELIAFERAVEILEKAGVAEIFVTDNLQKNEKFENVKSRLVSYEEEEVELAPCELEIVIEKAQRGEFVDVCGLKPLYIQTPPVFSR